MIYFVALSVYLQIGDSSLQINILEVIREGGKNGGTTSSTR